MWRTVWGWFAIVTTTAIFGTLALLTSWIPPRGRLYLFWARAWANALFTLAGIPRDVRGSRAAAGTPQVVYMASHESLVDIPLLLAAIPHDVRFLAKRSLFFVPFLGWSMWLAGFIPVDRERKEKARDVLEAVARRLRTGCSVLVFPEGTRSKDGSLGPFKKSGFLVALKAELPIVPIGVSGARDVIGRGGLSIRKGIARLRMGDPIPTAGLGVARRAELMDRVRAEIERLRAEP